MIHRGFSQYSSSASNDFGEIERTQSFISTSITDTRQGDKKPTSAYTVQKNLFAMNGTNNISVGSLNSNKLPIISEQNDTSIPSSSLFSLETKLPVQPLQNNLIETKQPMIWPSPQWDPNVPVIQPDVVTLDQVKTLPWNDIVLGTGVCYLRDGEAMKVCPYSLSVEMAMVEMDIKYKLIHTHLVGDAKEPWFVALHPKGKPSSPFLWSHGRWIFDTLPILDELMKRFPHRNAEAIMPLKDHMDARKTYKGSPLTKFAESNDNSLEHFNERTRIGNSLKPFIEKLRINKFLGGDKISFSDCHFCQQLGNGRQLVEYLEKVDVIEENDVLRQYWERLEKMKCFRIGRGSYAIRVAKRCL